MKDAFDLVGKIILINGYRNDTDKRVGEVIAVRDTHAQLIKGTTLAKTVTTRGRWLITINDYERDAVRSYYIAHTNQIRVLGMVSKLIRKAAIATGISEPKKL